jgi:hypothetical protein
VAIDPADVTPDMQTHGTWMRSHPRTGETQVRTAETAAEAVRMRWHGWTRIDDPTQTPSGVIMFDQGGHLPAGPGPVRLPAGASPVVVQVPPKDDPRPSRRTAGRGQPTTDQ